jgi:hypothetical protein
MGGNPEVMRYCSPLNPVFVDLVETAFVAHIRAYPDIERYGLGESEFPPGGAGVKACWEALDAKYNLQEKFPLAEILEKARKQFFYVEGRALAQAQGAIQTRGRQRGLSAPVSHPVSPPDRREDARIQTAGVLLSPVRHRPARTGNGLSD